MGLRFNPVMIRYKKIWNKGEPDFNKEGGFQSRNDKVQERQNVFCKLV